VVTDEFDADMFDENVDTGPHVEEDDEAAINESDEENMQPSINTDVSCTRVTLTLLHLPCSHLITACCM
jgi:hypothetical protein